MYNKKYYKYKKKYLNLFNNLVDGGANEHIVLEDILDPTNKLVNQNYNKDTLNTIFSFFHSIYPIDTLKSFPLLPSELYRLNEKSSIDDDNYFPLYLENANGIIHLYYKYINDHRYRKDKLYDVLYILLPDNFFILDDSTKFKTLRPIQEGRPEVIININDIIIGKYFVLDYSNITIKQLVIRTLNELAIHYLSSLEFKENVVNIIAWFFIIIEKITYIGFMMPKIDELKLEPNNTQHILFEIIVNKIRSNLKEIGIFDEDSEFGNLYQSNKLVLISDFGQAYLNINIYKNKKKI